jgi:hypothetical protein
MSVVRVVGGGIEGALTLLKNAQTKADVDIDLKTRFLAPGRARFLAKNRNKYMYWRKHSQMLMDRYSGWQDLKDRKKALGFTDRNKDEQ